MTNDTHVADGEALSIDQAADLLSGAPERDEEEMQAQGADEATADLDAPDEAEDDDADGGPVKPPHSWDADAREVFAKLPPEAQEIIAGREAERDRAVSLAQQEAAEARRGAQAAAEAAPYLEEALQRAAQLFQSQYDGVDWLAWAAQDPEGAQAARQDYERQAGALEQMEDARQTAEALHYQSFLAQEAAALPKLAPELTDPREGPARKAKLGGFLLEQGFSPGRIAHASAADLAIAYDAMRWREARAGLKPPSSHETAAEHRTVRPTAAQAPRSTQARRTSDALARLSRSGSVDDAVAYLKSRG